MDVDAPPPARSLASRGVEKLPHGRWIGIQIAVMPVTETQKVTRSISTGLAAWP